MGVYLKCIEENCQNSLSATASLMSVLGAGAIGCPYDFSFSNPDEVKHF
jgi:hypothetical protein